MANIDYYFATISPFTYLAGTRLEEVAAAHGAAITYKPMDLMAVFGRTGGVAPKDRHASRIEYRAQELRRAAIKTGLPMSNPPAFFPTNMAPSSYAIIAAQKAGGGDLGALTHSFLRACWAEDKNIAEDDVIRACLEAAGFDPALADSGMLSSADEYAANTEEAVNRGAFGAPFYITDGDERFWGGDRLDDLDAHLAGKV
ncbi:2-hydroxychromene-2-carboxylate isomerase [Candidatus Rhodobacter oscarellae]|uniref:2-hydroxychromene-2-carboxylate isomerase n=1 Tax=Candidatus Rhodobacter oscarellae TaxID=1675527 RepID=A0A0J9E2U3_9RHOB|nr:2-hydroxychromene-2-carboxylate isomerase [Candidatus Rhodobacter lobularis]KMW56099.1 2-hydroxychromene-2-carboxylate isomerase [Candidatus Rhodobacter lobularis]